MTLRTLAIVTLALVLSTLPLRAQRPQYRNFELGETLISVSAETKVSVGAARTVHERPALIQQLEWRPSYFLAGTMTQQTDPVQQIVFSFYNDQLFRLVINYDRQRTSGMTDADMIAAISTEYGPPLNIAVKQTATIASQLEAEFGAQVARWGDADYSIALHRLSYLSEFRLVVTSPRLEALARTAADQAVRLDEREAPQREIARQKQEDENARAAQEKARTANKAVFRP